MYNCFDGQVNFTLEWDNNNNGDNYVDLDLYVKCPCDTIIYFGNKKCSKCESELDHDHRYSRDAIEHVFIRNLTSQQIE
jgi:hypothetical protein